jgi:hypothetical protein
LCNSTVPEESDDARLDDGGAGVIFGTVVAQLQALSRGKETYKSGGKVQRWTIQWNAAAVGRTPPHVVAKLDYGYNL